MPAATLSIANVEITAILDVDTSIPFEELFDGTGDVPPGGWGSLAKSYPGEFTADAWHIRDHCFLMRTPSSLILIDAGIGPADAAFGRWLGVAGALPDELDALGVRPDEVDHVIISHIHSDDIGWSTMRSPERWMPRFANARYHVHGADVAWMRERGDDESVREFAEVIAPLSRQGSSTRRSRIARCQPACVCCTRPVTRLDTGASWWMRAPSECSSPETSCTSRSN